MMKKNIQVKRDSGFTLIELLLALALVVALVAAGMAAYQIQLRNFKVDKTALQMQQWLQAGLAFQADCGKWPAAGTLDGPMYKLMYGEDPLTALTCPKPANSDYIGMKRSYLLPGSEYGPWPPALIPARNSFYMFSPASGEASFYVETFLPPTAEMLKIGKMIAGRLPNATADMMPGNIAVRVRASVVAANYAAGNNPPPGGGGGSHIIDMEMVSSTQAAAHIKKPTQAVCDSMGERLGELLVPALVGSMAGIDARRANGDSGSKNAINGTAFNKVTIKNGFISEIDTVDKKPDGILKPTLMTQTLSGSDPKDLTDLGRNQVLLISACMPLCTVDPTNTKCKKALSSKSSVSSSSSGSGVRY